MSVVKLRAYKFLVMPVMQQIDEEGNVLGEAQPREPDVLFGVTALHQYADGVEAAIERKAAAMSNGEGQLVG